VMEYRRARRRTSAPKGRARMPARNWKQTHACYDGFRCHRRRHHLHRLHLWASQGWPLRTAPSLYAPLWRHAAADIGSRDIQPWALEPIAKLWRAQASAGRGAKCPASPALFRTKGRKQGILSQTIKMVRFNAGKVSNPCAGRYRSRLPPVSFYRYLWSPLRDPKLNF